MAVLQLRGKSWRVLFQFQRQQHAVTLGKIEKTEAVQWKGKIEHTLIQRESNL